MGSACATVIMVVAGALPLAFARIVVAAPVTSSINEERLGEELFRDRNLSVDRSVSCQSCHLPSHGFADGRNQSEGARQRLGTRHAPSLLHTDLYHCYFWDCRVRTLNEQVVAALLDPTELGFATQKEFLARIRSEPEYKESYQRIYGKSLTALSITTIVRPIIMFETSLAGGTTSLDQYLRGDAAALTLQQRQGLAIFRGRAHCSGCHTIGVRSASLTDGRFHESATGLVEISAKIPELVSELEQLGRTERGRLIETDPDIAALGRYAVTLSPQDMGKFRTPTLRDVGITGPYMHDGSIRTLLQAVDLELYYRGTELGHPIILSPSDRAALLAFLEGLSSGHPDSGRSRNDRVAICASEPGSRHGG